MVFGLNGGRGPRKNSGGPWTADNAELLMRYLHANHPNCVYGFELGK